MIHKTTRSILSVLLAVLLLVTSIPLTPAFAGGGGAVSPQSASGESEGLQGDGTAGNPYKIATADDLREFAKLVNGTDGNSADPGAHAKLMNNIDLEGSETNQWTPIGNSESTAYTGTFNGQNFKISGLTINSSSADDQGLFGYVSGTVKDLSVSGSVSGSVSSDDSLSGSPVGGVVGWNFGGTVTGCAFSGSVKGSGPDSGRIYVGGVVGYNSFGTVTNCYNTGNVSVTSSDISNVGGVVGYNHGGRVENCYNTGSVNGSGLYVGGVVGLNSDGTSVSASVTNCYNIGEVSGSSDYSYIGGVVGNNDGTVTGCYFLKTDDVNSKLQGIGSDAGSTENVKSLTAEEFAIQSSFTNSSWDFDKTWKIESIFGRPTLKANAEIGGTANNPYKIFTAAQLENFRDIVNGANNQTVDPDAHAKLMNDINLEGNATNQWTPIGNDAHQYIGTFDGDGHTISGLYIGSSDTDYQGLFGYLDQGGTVQDLTVSGSVKGKWYVGGVVGNNTGGTVTGCIFSGSGTVTGTGDYVGGVVGYNSGSVENCYNIGNVSGNNYVGGVVGDNRGSVENCYNTGTVNGSDYVGGVVGRNFGGVKNCYNTGTVSDGTTSGGVVGYNISSGTSAIVENCYFLQGTAGSGIGKNEGGGDATEKDDTAFHSGEVAYLLEQNVENSEKPVWGQSNLTATTSLPTLVALDKDAKPVYKVVFISDNTEIEAQYANSGMTVGSPTTNPTKEGYTFAGWFTKSSGGSQWNFSTAVTENMTLYAQWTAVEEPDPDPEPTPEPEPEEPPYTGKYSYELTTSVGDHGSLTVDRYATEGEKVTITVTPDEAYKLDDLSVTANGKDVELTANSDGTYTFTMPSADVKISATFAEDPDWTEPEEPATDVSDLFSDIAPDAWYKDAVQYAYDNGLMTGVSANEFAPEQTTTRAMIVSILARLENVTTAEAAGFADVDDEWYATAVNWAANVGVVNGYEDNTFQPNTAITREQLAAILMNYAAYKGEDVSNRADLASYTDQPSTWAQEAMQWAVAEKLITGVTNDELQPQGNATRAQVAAILQRFLSE